MKTQNRDDFIEENPDKLGGTPVFKGTRVPVRILYEYLEAGDPLQRFLEHFPTVHENQAKSVLELSKEQVTDPDDRDVA